MLAGIGLRHEHFDVFPGNLRSRITEQLLGRFIRCQDQAVAIDDDNAVERRIEHGMKQCVTAR